MHGSRWGGWAVAGAFYLFDAFLRLTVDVVTSELQAEFSLTADAVSAAFSSSFFYGYAAMQIPVGYLLDRLGPRHTIIIAALLSAAGSLVFSVSNVTWVGALARALSGVGCGCGWLGAVKVTRNSFGVCDNSRVRAVFAVTCFLGGFGGLVSQAPFGILCAYFGWRIAFRLTALVPVLIALGSFLLVGDEAFTNENDSNGSNENVDNSNDELHLDLLAQDGSFNDGSISGSGGFCRVLCRCMKTPRMWLYGGYLACSDAPFETFAGLWGVAFFQQVYGWSKSKAALGTTLVVLLSTVAQLFAPPLQSRYKTVRERLVMLTCVAILGALSFVAFILPGNNTALAFTSCVTLGLSVISCTLVWSIISSDPLCEGTKSTGIISGAVNTLCIAFDAIVQQIVGVVLAAMWQGTRNERGEPTYSASAFSFAFAVLLASFIFAGICSSVAATMTNRI